jgi:hypothetical protein
MPGELDGYQLAIAANKLCPALKTMLTSGFTKKKEDNFSPEDANIAKLKNKLLPKPYSIKELALAVRNVLDEVN